MRVRAYRPADRDAVVAIYQAAVHELTADHYDAAQRQAWAPSEPDRERWSERLGNAQTLVAERDDDGELMGFIAYQPTGYIDLLFTAPAQARQGVASALYARAEAALTEAGVTELDTEASLVARPFFEKQGFRVVEAQQVRRHGQVLRRFSMRKRSR